MQPSQLGHVYIARLVLTYVGSPWYAQCVETPWDNGGGHPTSTAVTTTTTRKSTTTSSKTTSKATTVTKTTTSKPTTTKEPSTTTTTTMDTVTTIITTLPPLTPKPAEDQATTITLFPDDPFTKDQLRQTPASQADKRPPQRRQSSPANTLQPGWSWIRAIAQPNHHKYLQTQPAAASGPAVLSSYRTASQFKLEDGQIIANTGTPLYLNVERPTDLTQRRALATWFNGTRNGFGAFAWQGDALTWSAPEVERPDRAAWFVCGAQALFVNTGAYADRTPAGCVDQTVRFPPVFNVLFICSPFYTLTFLFPIATHLFFSLLFSCHCLWEVGADA